MGLEQGAVYTLVGPDGTTAVFNDPTSPYFIGYLTEPPSIGADVRENAEELAQGDGGLHYDFFLTRLNAVFTGMFTAAPGAALNAQIERLQRAAHALRADALISWSESGDVVPRVIRRMRRNQRVSITDRLPRRFQVSLTSTDAYVMTDEIANAGVANNGVGTTQANVGNVVIPPRISVVAGAAMLNPIFKNTTTGAQLKLLGTYANALVVDLYERTATHNGVDVYGDVDWLNSSWWGLAPGANKIEVTDTNGIARAFTLYRKHGWSA